MDSEHDYYSILAVPRDAPDAEIRRAFRALAKEHHPDSRGPAGSGESSQRDFRLITEAYETLRDPNRRAAYDRELDEARQLAALAARTGRQSYAFAVGLGAGILLAVVAVGAVAYIGRAGHGGGEKAQDSLQRFTVSEKPADAGSTISPQQNIKAQEDVEGSSLSTEARKSPQSPPAPQPAWTAPAPIDVSSSLPAERHAAFTSGEF